MGLSFQLSSLMVLIGICFSHSVAQDQESGSGMYIMSLDTLTAKKHSALKSGISHNFTDNLSVPRGTSKRKAILDALRLEAEQMVPQQDVQIIFVVKYLKAKDGWAWIHTLPQSQDGYNHYEDIFALLKKRNGAWRVIEIPCAEEENPECISNPAYFSNLQKRFPEIPEEILP